MIFIAVDSYKMLSLITSGKFRMQLLLLPLSFLNFIMVIMPMSLFEEGEAADEVEFWDHFTIIKW